MRKGHDISVQFPGLYLVHHNLPGKEVDLHSHPEHLLFLPLQGEIEVSVETAVLKAGPGKMIYLPEVTPHAFRSSQTQGERLIALLSRSLWNKIGGPKHPVSVVASSQLCKELLFYLLLHPATKQGAALVRAFAETLAETLAASSSLFEVEHLEAKIRDERVRRALQYFRTHLGDPISMEEVASKSGLSVRSFNRLFSVELGLTPKQALAQYRVSKARELLSGGAAVTETAFQVGYHSLAQFIAVFRHLTGQLPSEFARLGSRA